MENTLPKLVLVMHPTVAEKELEPADTDVAVRSDSPTKKHSILPSTSSSDSNKEIQKLSSKADKTGNYIS